MSRKYGWHQNKNGLAEFNEYNSEEEFEQAKADGKVEGKWVGKTGVGIRQSDEAVVSLNEDGSMTELPADEVTVTANSNGSSSQNQVTQHAGIINGDYSLKDVVIYGMGTAGFILGGTEAHLRNLRESYAAKGTKTAKKMISKVMDPSINKISRTAKVLGWGGVGLNATITGVKWFKGEDITASQLADIGIGAGLIVLGGTVAVFSAPAALVAVGAYGVLDSVGAFDGVKESLGGNTVIIKGFEGY